MLYNAFSCMDAGQSIAACYGSISYNNKKKVPGMISCHVKKKLYVPLILEASTEHFLSINPQYLLLNLNTWKASDNDNTNLNLAIN